MKFAEECFLDLGDLVWRGVHKSARTIDVKIRSILRGRGLSSSGNPTNLVSPLVCVRMWLCICRRSRGQGAQCCKVPYSQWMEGFKHYHGQLFTIHSCLDIAPPDIHRDCPKPSIWPPFTSCPLSVLPIRFVLVRANQTFVGCDLAIVGSVRLVSVPMNHSPRARVSPCWKKVQQFWSPAIWWIVYAAIFLAETFLVPVVHVSLPCSKLVLTTDLYTATFVVVCANQPRRLFCSIWIRLRSYNL